jgi:hypothetical protein
MTAYDTSPTTVPASRYPAAAFGRVPVGVAVTVAVGVVLGVSVGGGGGGGV